MTFASFIQDLNTYINAMFNWFTTVSELLLNNWIVIIIIALSLVVVFAEIIIYLIEKITHKGDENE